MNRITKGSEVLPFDPDAIRLSVSRHFHKTWMRKWGWSYHDIREALRNAHRVVRAGRAKWEVFVRKKGEKKLVVAFDEEAGEVYVITAAEG